MSSLDTMNPGEGDSGRLCHAGPHKAAEFPRGLVSTEPRGISALNQTPISSFYSLLNPPTLNMAAIHGHTVTIFTRTALIDLSVL